MNRTTLILLHCIVGVSFVVLPVLFAPQPAGYPRFHIDIPTIRDVLSNTLMLAFFYLNYYLLIPKIFLQRRYGTYALLITLALLLIVVLPGLSLRHPHLSAEGFENMIPRGPHRFSEFPASEFMDFVGSIHHLILLFTIVILFSVLLRIREQWQLVEQAKSMATISSLKNQINPHLLFNTLNAIYGLAIREGASKTGESILRISGMMRYVVTEASKDLVKLSTELNYVDHYIRLQSLRISDSTQVSYAVHGASRDLQIAPLLLLPFIENAYKYGVNPDKISKIDILITVESNRLSMHITNDIVNSPLQQFEVSGVGMRNTLTRLQLIYPGQFELKAGIGKGGHYQTNLMLNL